MSFNREQPDFIEEQLRAQGIGQGPRLRRSLADTHPIMTSVLGWIGGMTLVGLAETFHLIPSLDVNWFPSGWLHFLDLPGDIPQLAGGVVGMIMAESIASKINPKV